MKYVERPAPVANDPAGAFRIPTPPLPRFRRMLFFGLIAGTLCVGVAMMFDILSANGMTLNESAILVLFVPAFAWIALSFWTGMAGIVLRALRLDPLSLRRVRIPKGVPVEALSERTAVVMPIYNESTARVLAGLAATYTSLQRSGAIDRFDFFILSDTTDPEIAQAEEAGWAALRCRLGAEGRLFYRRRARNVGRKPGNIGEFCRRWGRNYAYMVVLDADSVMSGEAILRLALTMQATPDAGIVQTAPRPAGQQTVFGRFAQFAARLYCPVLVSGMSFWQMGEANFWGHNAIVRIAAFTGSCGLPTLKGREPFGGEILSHDFVEAALIRRNGWRVYMLPDVPGSYEEVPGNLVDFAKRDRRWAQGNLQHLGLLAVQGLHPMSRLHFFSGALAYVSSLIWLALLVLSTVDALARALIPHEFFGPAYQLHPDWLVVRADTIVSLLTLTIVMLLLPKVLALLLAIADREQRRAFGGAVRLSLGAVAETLLAILLAPLMMCLHAYFVVAILAGRSVKWLPQNREGERLAVAEVSKHLLVPTLAGLLWGAATLIYTPGFFWWLTPVVIGLVAAVPTTAYSSSATLGRLLGRWGVFCTPEEMNPPAELRLDVSAARGDIAAALAVGMTADSSATPPELMAEMPVQALESVRLPKWRLPRRGREAPVGLRK